MKKTMIGLAAALVVAGSASADTLTYYDDAPVGNTFGNTSGFAIDFDASLNFASAWSTPLVAGQEYAIDSISFYEQSDNVNPVSLSVFGNGYTGYQAAGFLGYSDQAIDYSATANGTKVTYTFTGLSVVAGNDGVATNGATWFMFTENTNSITYGAVNSVNRLNYDTSVTGQAAHIIAFGTIQTARSPEIEVVVHAIPEPATIGMVAAFGVGVLFIRRRLMM